MDDGDHDTGNGGSGTDPVRGRFETAISLAAPLLDLVLAVGDRVSRIAEPVDYEYYPVRGESGPDRDDHGDEGERERGPSGR
jgi:uncharacterized protein (DUF58 family)